MASPSLPAVALDLAGRIGRYFNVVSVVPALFLTAWTTALVTSDAWKAAPDLRLMVHRLAGINLAGAVWLVLTTTMFALFLHPLQLGMTRLLEGYWGSSWLSRILLRRAITHHRKRRSKLHRRYAKLAAARDEILLGQLVARYEEKRAKNKKHQGDPRSWAPDRLEQALTGQLADDKAHAVTGLHAASAAADIAFDRYPEASRVMPTRLGNALRSGEDTIGSQYGLDAILTAPHVALIAPPEHVGYLQDARQQLDTAVRLCVVALIVTAETAACLLLDGWWLFVALAPYLLAWIAYRSSVAAADHYMAIVGTVLDLNRFKLYESLHVKLPMNTVEERWNNRKLMAILERRKNANVRYEHPAAGTPSTGGTAPTPPGTP
ncbi:hypothetical protein [Amycolatopsis sp. MtRt-6]|uniref:hypothetical protein n=1 Tax=Amycolatopsis sp. MtRt-6 TaxID=2792782 RepID=UPI001A8D27E9|nr:hypothetical protein [Amycolatopsis sp. MtRt-6]